VHRYLLHNRLGWWQQKGPPAAQKVKTIASHPFMLGTPGENLKPAVLVQAVRLIVLKFQLVLGDYFRVYIFAAQIAESATNLIGWLNNQGKVHKTFDASQAQISLDRTGQSVILAYLSANLTRWICGSGPLLRMAGYSSIWVGYKFYMSE
jgi:hypothetical protein